MLGFNWKSSFACRIQLICLQEEQAKDGAGRKNGAGTQSDKEKATINWNSEWDDTIKRRVERWNCARRCHEGSGPDFILLKAIVTNLPNLAARQSKRKRLRDLWAPLHPLLLTNELTRPTRCGVCGLWIDPNVTYLCGHACSVHGGSMPHYCPSRPHVATLSRVIKSLMGLNKASVLGMRKMVEQNYFTPQWGPVSTGNVQELVWVHVYVVMDGAKVVTALLFISVTSIFSCIVHSNRIHLYSCANCSCFNEGRRLGVPGHSGSCCGGSGGKCGGSRVQWRPRHEAPGQGRTGRPVHSYNNAHFSVTASFCQLLRDGSVFKQSFFSYCEYPVVRLRYPFNSFIRMKTVITSDV